MASTANWKYTQRQRGDTNAQTDGDRSKNDHSGTTDELFGRVDTQQMEGQQWRRQIANPLPKKYQLLSARQKYSVSVIVVRRSLDYRFDEPFLPTVMEVSGWGGQSTYAAGRLDPRFPPLGWAGGRQLYRRQHPPKNFCLARRCFCCHSPGLPGLPHCHDYNACEGNNVPSPL